jgi:hypothetical protein
MFSSSSCSWTLMLFSQSCYTRRDSQFSRVRMGQFMCIRTSDIYLQILQLTLEVAVENTRVTKNYSKNMSIFLLVKYFKIYIIHGLQLLSHILEKISWCCVHENSLVTVNIRGKLVAINLLDNAFNVRLYSESFYYSNFWIDIAVLTFSAGKWSHSPYIIFSILHISGQFFILGKS